MAENILVADDVVSILLLPLFRWRFWFLPVKKLSGLKPVLILLSVAPVYSLALFGRVCQKFESGVTVPECLLFFWPCGPRFRGIGDSLQGNAY
jgi:hypothetical protein